MQGAQPHFCKSIRALWWLGYGTRFEPHIHFRQVENNFPQIFTRTNTVGFVKSNNAAFFSFIALFGQCEVSKRGRVQREIENENRKTAQ